MPPPVRRARREKQGICQMGGRLRFKRTMLQLLGRRKSEEERRDELLSAYLDGELGEHELQRLEARLVQDAALREELTALRQTVALVQELPKVAAPRNLILTESMVGRGERAPGPASQGFRRGSQHALGRAWTAPLLTAATAVVCMLFAIVLTGDLLLRGMGGLASVPESMEEAKEIPQIALEAAPADEGAQVEREVAPVQPTAAMLAEEAPPAKPEMVAVEKEAAEGEAEAPESPTPAPAAVAEAPADRLEMAAEEEGEAAAPPVAEGVEETGAGEALVQAETPLTPMGGGGTTEEPAIVAVPTVQQTVAPAVIGRAAVTPGNATEAPAFSSAPAEGEAWVAEPAPEEIDAASPPIHAEERGLRAPARRNLPWRVLQVGLGLTAVVLAFATIQAWRLRRR